MPEIGNEKKKQPPNPQKPHWKCNFQENICWNYMLLSLVLRKPLKLAGQQTYA